MYAFIDRLIQSISQKQDWYVKDKTDFLNFIEGAKLPKNTFLVSMGVTCKPPHQSTTRRERKHRMLRIRGFFHADQAPIPTKYLREMLLTILLPKQQDCFFADARNSCLCRETYLNKPT